MMLGLSISTVRGIGRRDPEKRRAVTVASGFPRISLTCGMVDRDKPPKARSGFRWVYRRGCLKTCACPWRERGCAGQNWPHWIEVRDDDSDA